MNLLNKQNRQKTEYNSNVAEESSWQKAHNTYNANNNRIVFTYSDRLNNTE